MHQFSPNWGHYQNLLWDLIHATQNQYVDDLLQSWLDAVWEHSDGANVQFSISLLDDILAAGGKITERDSKLYVSWPDWSSKLGHQLARTAMQNAREIRPLTNDEIKTVEPCFSKDLSGVELAQIMEQAHFSLRPAEGCHKSGVPYKDIFAAALRYWSMPYRGRTGRSTRFILEAEHPILGDWPVTAGIIELGDEAPFCRWRDDLLGLSSKSFLSWLESDAKTRAKNSALTLKRVRKCLLPIDSDLDISSLDAKLISDQKQEFESYSKGRSKVTNNEQGIVELKRSKRIAHGLRLARGEHALRKIAKGEASLRLTPDLSAGIRGLHDIFLTRLHMEVTICGAVPPFNFALGGKLITAFFTHPSILQAPLRATSSLLSMSFDMSRLQKLLPTHGMFCITTKGLYPGHAAIYNRAEFPGASGPIKLRRLAETEGGTTSLVSSRTSNFARAVLKGKARAVSSVYGSGGSKRHRLVETAMHEVNLPSRLAMAGIRRPVYGTKFVSNPEAVLWAQSRPEWLVQTKACSSDFTIEAQNLWRGRWLRKAQARCNNYLLIPSLPRILMEGCN